MRAALKRLLRFWVFPVFCMLVLYPYMLTVRVVLMDQRFRRARKNRKEQFLYGHWHEDIPLFVFKFGFQNFCAMVSTSKDGEVMTRILRWLGFRVVRGSPKERWREAFQEAVPLIREGWDLALAVDGPKGPPQVVKPGIIYLGQKERIRLIPAVCDAKYKFRLKSWDSMWFPLPFSPAICIFGDPITIEEGDFERQRKAFETTLADLKAKLGDRIPW